MPFARGHKMADIVLIDTSVFLNILDVPAFNQERQIVLDEVSRCLEQNAVFLLPIAAIVETGNHIAQLASGGDRRRFAVTFCEQVNAAISGEAPWQAMRTPDTEMIQSWLPQFPEFSMREIGMGDLSIIKDWEDTCRKHTGWRVRIWSLDNGLMHYDRAARI